MCLMPCRLSNDQDPSGSLQFITILMNMEYAIVGLLFDLSIDLPTIEENTPPTAPPINAPSIGIGITS